MGGFLETGHEYACEAYGGEIVDRAYDFLICAQRYLELVPLGVLVLAVAAKHVGYLFVGYEVLADLEILRTYRDAVLEIALIFVKGVVLVDILHVRHTA